MQPLHPMVVHFPIVLALLAPLAAGAVLWHGWRGAARPRMWLLVVALQCVAAASGWAAMWAGERDEDVVERVVGEAPLHAHEEAAEVFVITAGVAFALALAALFLPWGGAGRATAAVTVAAMIAAGVLVFRAGKSGGELVYVHNAGAAHSISAPSAAPSAAPSEKHRKHEKHDDD